MTFVPLVRSWLGFSENHHPPKKEPLSLTCNWRYRFEKCPSSCPVEKSYSYFETPPPPPPPPTLAHSQTTHMNVFNKKGQSQKIVTFEIYRGFYYTRKEILERTSYVSLLANIISFSEWYGKPGASTLIGSPIPYVCWFERNAHDWNLCPICPPSAVLLVFLPLEVRKRFFVPGPHFQTEKFAKHIIVRKHFRKLCSIKPCGYTCLTRLVVYAALAHWVGCNRCAACDRRAHILYMCRWSMLAGHAHF